MHLTCCMYHPLLVGYFLIRTTVSCADVVYLNSMAKFRKKTKKKKTNNNNKTANMIMSVSFKTMLNGPM